MSSYRYNIGLAFSDVSRKHADRPALQFPGARTVSYREFDCLVNKFAAVLADRGLGPRDVLGIVHTKTFECFAAMLAALKLGAAYVNLDNRNPAPRLRHIFSTARPKIVFAQSMPDAVREAVSGSESVLLELCDPGFERDLAGAGEAEPQQSALATGSDPAYIMYTSGSTGVPKGAILTHDNVMNFAAWSRARFGIEPSDVLTNINPLYFDFSVCDFYGAILNGASTVPIAQETLAKPALLLSQIEQAACTVWSSVPSLLVYLTTLKLLTPERLPKIRQFIFCGEVYPKPELRKLHSAFGDRCALVNAYGPTECTCFCSAWNVTEEDLADLEGSVPLGAIAENCSALVLTEDRRSAAPGEVGELYVMGTHVGLGYVNDRERTDRAFVANPLNDRWPERAYKTGDLVRLGTDGRRLEYVGRADNQIKHMGYRIELEEIEAALNRIDGVVQSAVVYKADRSGVKIIAAYVASGDGLTKVQLRERLARLLPPYMIPQHIELRGSLPKNANGKIDRVALAAE
jgi:D-alanine--poly(phosphoribitol) ligase subunit 1